MKYLHVVAFVLLIIGGLNWLLFALTGNDVSQWFGGMNSQLAQIVYILVGLSAVYLLFTHKQACRECMKK